MKRHPELIRKLSRQGVELAVHGYIHIDYGVLSQKEQIEHYQKLADALRKERDQHIRDAGPSRSRGRLITA